MAKLRHYLTTTIAIILVMAGPLSADDAISISAEISSASMAFEAKDTLTVRLTWAGEPFLYQINDFPMPTLEKLEILGSSSSVASSVDSTVEGGEITTRTFRYILQPTDFGTGIVNPLNLTAKHRESGEAHDLKTGRLTIEIAKPVPREVPESGDSTLIFIIMAIVIIGGGVAAFIIIRRKPKAEEIPADLSYLENLKEIRKESVADKKLFYARLYRLLLSYLEKERGLEVSGKTGDEVTQIVNGLEDGPEKANLTLWINLAQKVKYRPEEPSAGDVENTYNAVYKFFEDKLQKG